MITLDTFGVVTLISIIVSVVINIIQYQKQRQMRKETLRPIYNGLIGLFFNDVKSKSVHCYERRNLLLARNNPYNTIESLRGNFCEFIAEAINHFESLREYVVPILKTIEPNEERIFKAADFAVTNEEKEARKKFHERWLLQEKIQLGKLTKELEQLKSIGRNNKKSAG